MDYQQLTLPMPSEAQQDPLDDRGAGFWLWVDPRIEPGYNARDFDQASFLRRAVALFQTKERWAGQPPRTVKANPKQATNGLGAVADKLGLAVASDPTVPAGTYWLGIDTVKGGG